MCPRTHIHKHTCISIGIRQRPEIVRKRRDWFKGKPKIASELSFSYFVFVSHQELQIVCIFRDILYSPTIHRFGHISLLLLDLNQCAFRLFVCLFVFSVFFKLYFIVFTHFVHIFSFCVCCCFLLQLEIHTNLCIYTFIRVVYIYKHTLPFFCWQIKIYDLKIIYWMG